MKHICKIDNCDQYYRGYGLCGKHLERFRKWKDPYYTEIIYEHTTICLIQNCNDKYHSNGLCRLHYNKEYYRQNKEKCNNNGKKWREQNRKHHREHNRIYAKNHPEVNLKAKKKQLEKLGKSFDLNSTDYLFAIQNWAKTIKKLDNYMCKNCDSTSNLNAHHIQPKREFPKLSLDLDNGITLCEDCHGETHGFEIYH